jgi:pimeloyl-ACP methyl ester carboxylesterase
MTVDAALRSYIEGFTQSADGTRLWWASSGEGPPPVLLLDGIGCAGFIWKHVLPRLSERHRVLRLNYRCHGRSGVPEDPHRVSVLDCVDDVFAVLDAAGEQRVVLAGHSMGVQVALEAHRRARERICGLVLVCGSYGRLLDTFHDGRGLKIAFPYLRKAISEFPNAAKWVLKNLLPTELAFRYARAFEINGRLIRREDFFPYLQDMSQMDMDHFLRMLSSAASHDAYDHLGQVDVPTLVVAGERDTFTPMWLSVRMHSSIRGSELAILPGGTHVAPLEQPDMLWRRLEHFLRNRVTLESKLSSA